MSGIPDEVLQAFDSYPDEKKQLVLKTLAGSNPAMAAAIQSAHKDFKNRPGLWEAMHRGATKGMALNFDDELAGVTNAVTQKAVGLFNKDMPNESFRDLYREGKADWNKRNAEAEKSHGTAFKASEFAGAIPTAIAGGGIGSGVVGAGATGAAYGGGAGLGGSDADLTSGKAEELLHAAKDTGVGALAGAVTGSVIHGGFKGAAALGGKALDAAAMRAFLSAHPELNDLRNLTKDEMLSIGKRLLKEKFVRFGDTTEKISNRLEPAVNEAGKATDQALLAANESHPGVDTQTMVENIAKKKTPNYSTPAQADTTRPILDREMENLREFAGQNPNLGLLEAEKMIKRPYSKQGRWDNATPGPTSETMRDIGQGAENEIEAEVAKAGPDKLAAYQAAKKRYGELAPAHDMASEATLRAAKKNNISLTDQITALGLLGVGGAKVAVPGTILNHFARTRGSASTAVTMEALAKVLGLGTKGLPLAGPMGGTAARMAQEEMDDEEKGR